MSGPCMCGDTECPVCGPLQGHDPRFDTIVSWIETVLLADLPAGHDANWWAEELANRIGRSAPQEVVDAVQFAAEDWERQQRAEARGVSW